MARPSRIISTVLFTLTLSIGFTPAVQSQSAQPPAAASTPSANNADYVAPGREDLEPAEPGFDDNTVDNQAGKNWHPTTNPKSKVTPGQMRSDKEEIPGGFTKEQANRAEVQEAEEQATQARSRPQNFAVVDTCRTYWPSPFKVCGKIREKYDSLGGPRSFLTWPKSDELKVPDGVGRRNEFVNGFIYWHPNTGAHPITTHFSVAWARTGWERGPLGYPTTDEFGLSDGIGRKQSFEHGHIYGSLAGLATIRGAIYNKWVHTGAEKGPLGYPTGDETITPDGIGRFSNFVDGKIYWHPQHGAHEVRGLPLVIWSLRGYEKSEWGYPTGSAQQDPEAPVLVKQDFSKKPLDARAVIDSSGESLVNGKIINKFALELLESRGLTLPVDQALPSGITPQTFARSVSRCPIPDSTQDQYGGVTIPSEYDYWACIDGSKDWVGIGRHDYCTNSPDQFPSPGQNAEFSGGCARHDICMDEMDRIGIGYGSCNNKLWRDMETICTNVYSGPDPRRYGCRDFRDTYWVVVTGFHSDNL